MEIGKLEGKVCTVCGAEEVYIGKNMGSITEGYKTLIEFEVRTCTCHECGAPVYYKAVDRYNRVADAEAFREVFPNLLKVSEIRDSKSEDKSEWSWAFETGEVVKPPEEDS